MRSRLLRVLIASSILLTGNVEAASVCGDVNDNDIVSSSDALEVLKAAVGQPVDLVCVQPGALATTGQTLCYDDAGTIIDCDATGQDGEFSTGLARSFTDNGDGTITDDVTGLMWEKLSNDGSIHDRDEVYSWDESAKLDALNASEFAGYDDWRSPNIRELRSLVHHGRNPPLLYPEMAQDCFTPCSVLECSCASAATMWSSTTQSELPDQAYYVSFTTGHSPHNLKTGERGFRAVRGGP